MATDEDRLSALEAQLEQIELPDVQSAEELARHEAVRAATMFGQTRPRYRTLVRLRFHGPGVKGHDLPGHLAGAVVAKFVDTVKAAGDIISGIKPADLVLFLSPTVAPGSTILELYGTPRRTPTGAEPMGEDIDDTPVDVAVRRVFQVLETVDVAAGAELPQDLRVEGMFGQRLWQLSKELVASDVDLDLHWQSPRGRASDAALGRTRARALKDLLDRPTTTSKPREADGELVTISTDRTISVRIRDVKQAVVISAGEEHDLEELRQLWARPVHIAWTETTVSHPQREGAKTTRTLDSIRLQIGRSEHLPGVEPSSEVEPPF